MEGNALTLQDFVYATYNSLLDAGWHMQEIDQMDVLGFLTIRAWSAQKELIRRFPQPRYIDEVWPGLKP